MSAQDNSYDLAAIEKLNDEQLYALFVSEAVSSDEIWILTDQYGSVMLNTEDEDCVPVWPYKKLAEAWATGEWEACKAEAISLSKWHSRWTPGLEDDEFAVVVCPTEGRDGLVVSPLELDKALKKRKQKQST
ncbi:DUF2750 domain-containing protein [Neptuniibacter marinus]|uniref:DUF2750 domain-containing protein n=1 Tax=Neptuniibacter marinus TaxID=1806670 RepID=UPI000836ABAE|nr:DUF2750 domain-containing protein [Neptuniibacter marinus]